jgi:type I restriction enzyme S subunit
MTLGKYLKYKASDVEWIGEIPETWTIKKIQDSASTEKNAFVDGPFGSDLKNEEYVDAGIPLIQLNNVGIGYHDLTNLKFITEKKYIELIRHSALPGDIVIAKMADPVARASIISNKWVKYTIVADCVKLTVNNRYNLNFLIYVLNSYVRSEAELKAVGTTRLRINLSKIKKLRIVSPPKDEQNKIVSYLDSQTSNLNCLIQAKNHQIELLQVHEKSLIHHAVTKGLDPNAKMKDSGVEWIGKVPDNWTTKRFKYLCDYDKGKAPAEFLDTATTNALPYLEMGYLRGQSEPKYTTLSENSITVNDGDLLLLWDGSKAGEFVTGKRGILSSTMAKICEKKRRQSLKYIVKSFESILIDLTNGMGIPHVRADILMNMRVPVAPDNEDEQIALYLDSETANIHRAINNIEKSIAQLEEYRKALIYEVVTGKVKVG